MVRNNRVEVFDDIARPIIALGNDFPDGYTLLPHQHRRSQLLYAASGAIIVGTVQGSWVVPPHRGIWIPGGVAHSVQMLGAVSTRSLYLEPGAIPHMPPLCQVVSISPFMRNLMQESVDLPVDYDPDSRAGALMTLIQHEMQQLQSLPLALIMPAHDKLSRLAQAFLQTPSAHAVIDDWAASLGISRRSFTRLFRAQTGLSFAAWRQQACLFAALPRLIAGEAVTAIAIDLGYDNPAAFTAMFKRSLGLSPRNYLKQNG